MRKKEGYQQARSVHKDRPRVLLTAFASALLPTAAASLLDCVELFELDEHSKTDPTVDDLDGATEGVNIA